MIRWLPALVLMSAASAAQAAEAGPADLPGRFIAAWNAHDPQAFAALYTDDAVWVPVAEERTRGRAAIVGEFAKIHAADGWASHTTIAPKDSAEVHEVTATVSTVFFHMDFIADGKPVPGLQRALILVAVKRGHEWKIAAGQLTKESPPPR